MSDATLQILIDELDELSAWLWMGDDNKKDIAVKLDRIVDRHRPKYMLGD